MKEHEQSFSRPGTDPFAPLVTALRRQEGDARVWELFEHLRKRGYGQDVIVAAVVKSAGANAGVRIQKLAQKRTDLMATGTWQRYKPTRARRLRLWLRGVFDSVGGFFAR